MEIRVLLRTDIFDIQIAELTAGLPGVTWTRGSRAPGRLYPASHTWAICTPGGESDMLALTRRWYAMRRVS